MKKIMDGNTACASIAYKLSQVAPIYPITPSSTMAELCDVWSQKGEKNILNQMLEVVELQSEAGASGALHGALRAGTLATTFTASQGLLLMIPNMYKIAGECLPGVIHVSARALATHALSIYGDHSDVMACRGTGFAMLCSSNPQEAHDMALVSHLSALDGSLPFLHFFDGFRTSHELTSVETLDLEQVKSLVDFNKIESFRKRGLSNVNPQQSGTSQGADVYFANREACNTLYNNLPKIVQANFDKVEKLTNRQYHLFDYYGSKKAENVIVVMGSASDVISETLDALKKDYPNFGVLVVRLYRPFATDYFINALPKTVKTICVLDRTKESGSLGEPLFLDVASAVQQAGIEAKVIGGRYGLGSFEFNPAMVKAVMDNMLLENPKNHFTVGINDDVTHLSLPVNNDFVIKDNVTKCMFFGLGGDGTVSANKNSAKIIGDVGGLCTQAYFVYDSKKSGSMTISHLRFGKEKIRSSYQIRQADFVAVHNATFLSKVDILQYLKPNGILLLNIPNENDKIYVPKNVKEKLIDLKANVYAINANVIASEIGLKNKINVIMQTAFFNLCPVIPFEKAVKELKKSIEKSYSKFGDEVVKNNILAISKTVENLIKVAKNNILIDENIGLPTQNGGDNDFYNNIMKPISTLNGEKIPVSAFSVDGFVPTDTSKFEKRGIATKLPVWKPENCIQCNFCSLVCPHSAIEPKLIDADKISEKCQSLNAFGSTDKKFTISCSPLDCTGCGNCEKICPAKNKAIVMQNAEDVQDNLLNQYDYLKDFVNAPQTMLNVKTSQFNESFFKYSGACAGCGQTPYIKLLTQLFGQEMIVANATGCSSIYAGSFPSCPYSKSSDGFGVAWGNSLFEDNAEFGLGLKIGRDKQREEFIAFEKEILQKNKKITEIYQKYQEKTDIFSKKSLFFELKQYLSNQKLDMQEQKFLSMLDLIVPSSQWIIGGDGWAYDIGYGGLDHILASNYDVNILVLDTEIYSNTGGQASKATPKNATAKFCEGGKQTAKKDLARIACAYPNTYVAKVCLSANPAHTLKCMLDAKNHKGPSIIIAYAPCVGQGVDLGSTPDIEKMAVSSGYWELLHRNPSESAELKIDSPPVTTNIEDFYALHARFKKYLKEKED